MGISSLISIKTTDPTLEIHETFMKRAIELAALGTGSVSPNPLVGCVVVHQDRIIGEGYHQMYGGPHAEPNALESVVDQSLLSESIVYVSLEPCSHWGKTPPCAQLLIDKKVKKVVIGAVDSNPLVGGKGIEMIKSAGIEVQYGILEESIRHQNRRFFTFMEKKRPFVILKWAQTRDGFIARNNFASKWISNPYSRQLVHKWRSEEDAVMIGTNTAKYDNPKLNVRDWSGKNPIRIVIDKKLQLDQKLALFDKSQPTLCYNVIENRVEENLEFVKLSTDFKLEEMLNDLYSRKIQSILVEGGSFLLSKFIENKLWDEARVITSKEAFGEGIKAPIQQGIHYSESRILGDRFQVWYSNKVNLLSE